MLNKSISQTLMICFVILLSLPLLITAPSFLKEQTNNIYKDKLKSHEALSQTIAQQISHRIDAHLDGLKFLDARFQQEMFDESTINAISNDYLNVNTDITALSFFVVENHKTKTLVNTTFNKKTSLLAYADSEKKYRRYNKKNNISSVYKSEISQRPAALMTHHILNSNDEKLGTLLMEIDLSFINDFCAGISFGIETHCTVVDKDNMLLSHHNKSLSNGITKAHNTPVLAKLKEFSQGSLQFTSQNNTKILAGYSKINTPNWGVFVTQPESVTTVYIRDFKKTMMMWACIGLLITLVLGLFIIHRITRPLKLLVSQSASLKGNKKTYLFGKAPKRASKDVVAIWNQLDDLMHSYHEVDKEVCMLSRTSNTDIRKLVAELRNKKLREPENIDKETGITNQQAFTSELQKCLHINKDKNIGLITFEIKNYSQVIKEKGHKAATNFMSQIASTINDNLRVGDMIMRHANSNHFSVYIDNNDESALIGSAGKLRKLIENSVITWRGELLSSDISTELLYKKVDNHDNAEKLILESLRS